MPTARQLAVTSPILHSHLRQFGINVRTERRMRRWSQEGLGVRVNLDRQTINRIENAAFATNVVTVIKLAIVFEIPFEQIGRLFASPLTQGGNPAEPPARR